MDHYQKLHEAHQALDVAKLAFQNELYAAWRHALRERAHPPRGWVWAGDMGKKFYRLEKTDESSERRCWVDPESGVICGTAVPFNIIKAVHEAFLLVEELMTYES